MDPQFIPILAGLVFVGAILVIVVLVMRVEPEREDPALGEYLDRALSGDYRKARRREILDRRAAYRRSRSGGESATMTASGLNADFNTQSPSAELASETLSARLSGVRLIASLDPNGPNAELVCPSPVAPPPPGDLTYLTLTEAQYLALTEAEYLALVE